MRLLFTILTLLDVSITVTSIALFNPISTFQISLIPEFLLFKNGYSYLTSPVDFIIFIILRVVLTVFVARNKAKQQKYHFKRVLSSFTLLSYSTTLIKLLVLSNDSSQSSYLGIYFISIWALIANVLWAVLWYFQLINKTENYGILPELYEQEPETNEESTIKDSEDMLRLPTPKLLKHFLHFAAMEKLCFILGLIFNILHCGSIVLIPLLVGHVVASMTEEQSLHSILNAAILFAIIAVSSAVFSGLRRCFLDYATAKMLANIRLSLFSNYVKQEIAFFDEHKSGELLSRLSSDCECMTTGINDNLTLFIKHLLTMIGCLCIMFAMSWRLTTISFVVIPINAIILYLFGTYFDLLSEKRQKCVSKSNQVAEEVLSTMRTVRSFAGEVGEINRFHTELKETVKVSKQRAIACIGYNFSDVITDNLMLIVVVFYGGYLVMSGKMASSLLITFILYQSQLGTNIYSMTDMFTGIMDAIGASRKVFEFINRQSQITNDGTLRPEVNGTISFEDVSFTYPSRPNQTVINGLSMEFGSGETVALVGASGGGKSSIVSLIEHFYEPQEGSIKLDGIPIREIAHDYYHQKISLVAQEPVLYDGSIRYNITYGCEWATEEDMINAAKMANVHSFVLEMEQGYDTKCGEKGVQMSGGQKQRIAIARALVRRPAVLILDEATSALDAESEAQVQDAISRCSRERTVIIVAHRLSTIEKANKIVVINKGKIEQIGRHHELMKDIGGIYYALVSKQILLPSSQPESILNNDSI